MGGKLNGNKGIYIYDDKARPTGKLLGESLTEYSFFGDNGKPVNGAVINYEDQSGNDFLKKEIVNNSPNIVYYCFNAYNGQKYDYKDRNIKGRIKGSSEEQYRYRGMPYGSSGRLFASARDIGNVGAGYIAGSNGMKWRDARLGFDGLQSFKAIKITSEGLTTQLAEQIGFGQGFRDWQKLNCISQMLNSSEVYQSFPVR